MIYKMIENCIICVICVFKIYCLIGVIIVENE